MCITFQMPLAYQYKITDHAFVLSCDWNFRHQYCSSTADVCNKAEKDGVSILHGHGEIFHNNLHPTFRMIYQAIKEVGDTLTVACITYDLQYWCF